MVSSQWSVVRQVRRRSLACLGLHQGRHSLGVVTDPETDMDRPAVRGMAQVWKKELDDILEHGVKPSVALAKLRIKYRPKKMDPTPREIEK